MAKKTSGTAKKIILFLSSFREDAQEESYTCPDGSKVTGTQTNEAPVKYLLHQFPDVSEVLCVVTPDARQSALAFFEQAIQKAAPNVKVTDLAFSKGEDFNAGPLAQIMSAVQKGDEILLETTGGLRDAIMYLLLVSRALSYSGIPTAGAVYSNYNSKQIVDCSRLIGLFDLVGGMQELASFGSVRALRDYYEKQTDKEPEIRDLLTAMEQLKEDITLCRTQKIDQRIDAFNIALEQAERCSNPLLRALLPAFRDAFDKKLSIPGLIKWCVENDMVQQALTIYKERIPNYILERKQPVLIAKKNALPPEGRKKYESKEEALFRTQMMAVSILENPERELSKTDFEKGSRVSWFKLQEILMDYAYIRLLRNKINHASEQDSDSQKKLAAFRAESPAYKQPDRVTVADVKKALLNGLDHLKNC